MGVLSFLKWFFFDMSETPEELITKKTPVSDNSIIVEYETKHIKELVFMINDEQFNAVLSLKTPYHIIVHRDHPVLGGYAITIKSETIDKKVEV